ncbi:unnamed protein product, partial [Effrenium voratum]
VEISGLKSKPELNGKRATVMLKDEAAGRFEAGSGVGRGPWRVAGSAALLDSYGNIFLA